jgi:hypothetical protein
MNKRIKTQRTATRRHARRAFALASLAIGCGIAAPAVSSAATVGTCWANTSLTCHPVMTTTWYPWLNPTSRGFSQWAINSGTAVDMQCWTTGATQLGTAKWFYVKSQVSPFTSGYVPANAVGNQIIVGHC